MSDALAPARPELVGVPVEEVTAELSGWGRFPREVCRLYSPHDAAHLIDRLRSHPGESFIARGLGRSYGDAAQSRRGTVVSMARFDAVYGFDPATGILDCGAGLSLDAIIRRFLPEGFFLPVSPGTRQVTIGGAIAADIHGKNHHKVGSFANHVLDVELVAVDGGSTTCSRGEDPSLFWATVGGMGLTGFIVRARIRLRRVESAYVRVRYQRSDSLTDTLRQLEEQDRTSEYTVAWVDFAAPAAQLGRAVLMFGEHALPKELPPGTGSPFGLRERRRFGVPFAVGLAPRTPLAIRMFNALYIARSPFAAERIQDINQFFYPLDAVKDWNRLFGSGGFVECQLVVPHTSAPAVLELIVESLRRERRAPFLGVLKRFGPGDEGMLSFPREGTTVGVDLPVDRRLPRLTRAIEAAVVGAGGRMYLAKDATMSAACVRAGYARLDEFGAVKRRIDPNSRLSSSQAERLGLVESHRRMAG
ncbi:MAG: FAD-binding oxidoreductase [Thermoplasmata archaeon]|nr:FAD-binding oxidoreductase [Thermoplasmata archaeon]